MVSSGILQKSLWLWITSVEGLCEGCGKNPGERSGGSKSGKKRMDLRTTQKVNLPGFNALLVEEAEGGDQDNIQVSNLVVYVQVGPFKEEKNPPGKAGLGESYLGLLSSEYGGFLQSFLVRSRQGYRERSGDPNVRTRRPLGGLIYPDICRQGLEAHRDCTRPDAPTQPKPRH